MALVNVTDNGALIDTFVAPSAGMVEATFAPFAMGSTLVEKVELKGVIALPVRSFTSLVKFTMYVALCTSREGGK
jgi:hypothetical protein